MRPAPPLNWRLCTSRRLPSVLVVACRPSRRSPRSRFRSPTCCVSAAAARCNGFRPAAGRGRLHTTVASFPSYHRLPPGPERHWRRPTRTWRRPASGSTGTPQHPTGMANGSSWTGPSPCFTRPRLTRHAGTFPRERGQRQTGRTLLHRPEENEYGLWKCGNLAVLARFPSPCGNRSMVSTGTAFPQPSSRLNAPPRAARPEVCHHRASPGDS